VYINYGTGLPQAGWIITGHAKTDGRPNSSQKINEKQPLNTLLLQQCLETAESQYSQSRATA